MQQIFPFGLVLASRSKNIRKNTGSLLSILKYTKAPKHSKVLRREHENHSATDLSKNYENTKLFDITRSEKLVTSKNESTLNNKNQSPKTV